MLGLAVDAVEHGPGRLERTACRLARAQLQVEGQVLDAAEQVTRARVVAGGAQPARRQHLSRRASAAAQPRDSCHKAQREHGQSGHFVGGSVLESNALLTWQARALAHRVARVGRAAQRVTHAGLAGAARPEGLPEPPRRAALALGALVALPAVAHRGPRGHLTRRRKVAALRRAGARAAALGRVGVAVMALRAAVARRAARVG